MTPSIPGAQRTHMVRFASTGAGRPGGFHWLLWLALLLLLGSCAAGSGPTPNLPAPEPGMGTATGRIISIRTNQPLPNMGVRLAELYLVEGEEIYILDTARSPGAFTDEQGNFVFSNIPARSYVLFLTQDEFTNAVVTEGEIAKAWDVLPDQITNFGDVMVEWP